MTIRSVIKGVGGYLPPKIVTNDDLSKFLDTNDEWIFTRTGISQRRVVEDEYTSDLATKAALKAIENAAIDPQTIDMILVATTTPDRTFPSTATIVQANLGIKGFAFDLQAVCSGFLYGLNVTNNAIRAGEVKRALLIGAETMSKVLDWTDRSSCILFGDGAGAFILEACENQDRGIISTILGSDGCYMDALYVDGGPSIGEGKVGHLRMQGSEVFKKAVPKLTEMCLEAIKRAGLNKEDIDWLVPHQANQRIINMVANNLSFPVEKIISKIQYHANTSAASIPLTYSSAIEDNLIKPGDKVLSVAFGAGLTWGGAVWIA